MELTCKVRHWVLNDQQSDAIPDKSGQALAGQPKKADLPGAIGLNIN